jgi:hypothetical protein
MAWPVAAAGWVGTAAMEVVAAHLVVVEPEVTAVTVEAARAAVLPAERPDREEEALQREATELLALPAGS